MNRRLQKFLSLILIFSMAMSVVSCSVISDLFEKDQDTKKSDRKHRRDDDDDDDDDDDEPDGTLFGRKDTDPTPTEIPTSEPTEVPTTEPTAAPVITAVPVNDLTYPDHIATYDEIHPEHKPGSVKGEEAKELLKEIELAVIGNNIDNYVDATIEFEHPENYGIKIDEISWGDPIDESDPEYTKKILDELYTIDYETLDRDDRIFYDKIVYDYEEDLYKSQFTAFDYMKPILHPLVGPQCDILFILEVFTFDDIEDAENYLILLKDLDRYFDEICAYEETRAAYGYADSDDQYEQIAVSFDNLVVQKDTCFLYDSFERRIDEIPGLSSEDRERLISENEDLMKNVVFPEFEECASRMRALIGSGGTGGGLSQYEGGKEYFAYIARAKSKSSKTMEENKEYAEEFLRACWAVYTDVMSGSDTSWTSEYFNHQYGTSDTRENLEFLREAIKDDFPELHEHSYFLMDVPEAFEDNFSPAAYLGYHLDNYDSNMIITNRVNIDNEFGITCAHEGYPGHMFQSVYTRSITEHPYMYLFVSIGYAEGWTTYIEGYCYKYYTEPSLASDVLIAYNDLNILLFLMADIGVNYEGWTLEELASYFSGVLGYTMPASSFRELYDIVALEPGYGIKYGMGFINTTLIMDEMHEKYPNASDKEIHTAYLDCLTGTYEQIEANMDKLLSDS